MCSLPWYTARMGFFDKFFRNKKPSERPDAAPERGSSPAGDQAEHGPELPCGARIAEFNTLDEVGTLSLSNGASLRFGRSACQGFEPVVGSDVVVRAIAPHRR